MTLHKIYTTFFDEEMKSRGFKRKGKLYYRLCGEILQGVVLKAINPYTIHFFFTPYWMENIIMETNPKLSKGYWAEQGLEVSPGSSSYFKPENVELNCDFMSACFDVAKKHILPVMDKVNSLEAYFEYCTPHWSGFDDERAYKRWVKFKPGEIDPKHSHLDAIFDPTITILWHCYSRYLYQACLKYSIDKGDITKGYELLQEKMAILGLCTDIDLGPKRRYEEYMTEDGLERAKKLIDDRKKRMKQRLKDELGLEVED